MSNQYEVLGDAPKSQDLKKLSNENIHLTIKNLSAGYGKMEILHKFDLFVSKAQSLCLIGPNGAGKSTILHSIYGFTNIFSGKIEISGKEITNMTPAQKLKSVGIAYILQDNSVFPDMTVEENLLMGGYIKDKTEESYAEAKKVLEKSGLFDTSFRLYGWEDLELGERLRNMGVKLIKCPKAIGYHWHPALALDQIPHLIRIEKERAKMGLVFYRKHPTLRVKFIIQYTFIHLFLWESLTLGGLINTNSIRPLLAFLIKNGQSGLAMEFLRLPLNLIGVRQIFREASSLGLR